MRLIGRRRPAGSERVPREPPAVELVERVRSPLVLRLDPDGGLLDLPGGRQMRRVLSFWPSRDQAGEWVEVGWPRHHRHGWFIAPRDLRLGHLIEFQPSSGAPLACWVASVAPDRLILTVGRDRLEASLDAAVAEQQWVDGFQLRSGRAPACYW